MVSYHDKLMKILLVLDNTYTYPAATYVGQCTLTFGLKMVMLDKQRGCQKVMRRDLTF